MKANNQSSGSGCALLFVGMVVLALVLWGIAFALQALGVIVMIAGQIIGVIMAVHGWRGVKRKRAVQQKFEQLQEIADDSRRGLMELQLDLDYVASTKGIGVDHTAAGKDRFDRVQSDVSSAVTMLEGAPNAHHLREAVVNAERVRLRARSFMPGRGHW